MSDRLTSLKSGILHAQCALHTTVAFSESIQMTLELNEGDSMFFPRGEYGAAKVEN